MLSAPSTNVSVQHAPAIGMGVPGFAKACSVALGSHGANSGAPMARIAHRSTRAVPAMPTRLSRSSANDRMAFISAVP